MYTRDPITHRPLYHIEQTIDTTKEVMTTNIFGEKVRGRLVLEKNFTVILEDEKMNRHVIRKERLKMPIPEKHRRFHGEFDRKAVERAGRKHGLSTRKAHYY